MDKAQKQLIDTYFRKRDIASGEYGYGYRGNPGYIKPFELLYMIKNDLINTEKAQSDSFGMQVAELLKYRPALFNDKDIVPYLYYLNKNNKVNILSEHPEFINYKEFNGIVDELEGNSIATILKKQPALLNKFDLSKLDLKNITDILSYQPQLVEMPFFDKALHEFKARHDTYAETNFWRNLSGIQYLSYTDKEQGDKLYNKHYKNFINALVKYPIYRELFPEDLKHMSRYNIVDLLRADKTLLPYLDVQQPVKNVLRDLLVLQPELITKVTKEQLDTLDMHQINDILSQHPELRKNFDYVLNPQPIKNYGSIRKQIEADDRFANLRQYINQLDDEVTLEGLYYLKKNFENKQNAVRNNREYDAYDNLINSVNKLIQMFGKQSA